MWKNPWFLRVRKLSTANGGFSTFVRTFTGGQQNLGFLWAKLGM